MGWAGSLGSQTQQLPDLQIYAMFGFSAVNVKKRGYKEKQDDLGKSLSMVVIIQPVELVITYVANIL